MTTQRANVHDTTERNPAARIRVAIAGATLFVAGSIVCLFAPNVWVLIAGRALQAGAGATGIVLSRAIAGELNPPDEARVKQLTRQFDTMAREKAMPAADSMVKVAESIAERSREITRDRTAQAEAAKHTAEYIDLGLTAFTVLVLIAIAIFGRMSIANPLRTLVKPLDELARRRPVAAQQEGKEEEARPAGEDAAHEEHEQREMRSPGGDGDDLVGDRRQPLDEDDRRAPALEAVEQHFAIRSRAEVAGRWQLLTQFYGPYGYSISATGILVGALLGFSEGFVHLGILGLIYKWLPISR